MVQPPAVVVIFFSIRSYSEDDGYEEMSEKMLSLAEKTEGYLGIHSVRDSVTGQGITVSYWSDDASARSFKRLATHVEAQHNGRKKWYSRYEVMVATLERSYEFTSQTL